MTPNTPLANSIDELADEGPFGRSKLYQLIQSGDLPARKCGKRTIILRDDFISMLRSLPEYGPETKFDTPALKNHRKHDKDAVAKPESEAAS